MKTKQGLKFWLLLACACWLPETLLGQEAYVNFEGKQTNPVRLSPDGTRLFAVNTPDSRLSVFDVSNPSNPILIAEIPVGLEPVSVHPRSNDEAWVVNEVSDSVSIVSVARGLVTATLRVKDEPADVVFAGGRAFVTASRNNQIHVFDLASHALLAVIPLAGENPRALAVGPGGTNVYAAFALSGNRTTLIPADQAPPQPPPTNITDPAPQVGLIIDATDPNWFPGTIQYTMPDNDVVEINVSSLSVTRYFSRVGTVNLGLAVHPLNGDLFVANADAANLTHFEPGINGRFYTNRIARITPTLITNYNLNPGATTNFPDIVSQSNALAQPTAIAFHPGGTHFYVAAFGSDRVARVSTNGSVLAIIETGPTTGAAADPRHKRGPRGLALHAGANRLYVLNRISNTISLIDTASDTVLREISTGSYDPTPLVIRQGRGFLYDARLSGNGTVSCASCHIDAEMDLLAWDLGDPAGVLETNRTVIPQFNITNSSVFHPMKGPMTTQTLRGLRGLDPFHWRGDRANFNHFNGAFASLLGGLLLNNADMNAYSNFIATVVFQPNPNQNLDRTLPASFAGGNPVQGRQTYLNDQYQPGLTCNTCHSLPEGSNRLIIPAAALQESQDFKVPHLRNMYQKTTFTPGAATSIGGFGFLHDGTFGDLFTFLSEPVFGSFANDTVRKNNLNAFLMCLDTGMAPAVGYTRTLNSTNLAAASSDWTLLENQALAAHLELVLHGTVDGQLRALLYQTNLNNYRSDKSGVGPFTRTQLATKIQAGDILSLMGTPPGSGLRLSLDRDQDGLLDGDASAPALQLARNSDHALLSWATNAYWFVLETAPGLGSVQWSTVTYPRWVQSNQVIVTNPILESQRFFRLRRSW